KCDFSKGLGPLVDTVAEAWDKAADHDPVPPKDAAKLEEMVRKAQKKIVDYAGQVMDGNEKSPEHGRSWWALYNALCKLDEAMTSDMKDIGLKAAPISGWVGKERFDLSDHKVREVEPSDGKRKDRKVGMAGADDEEVDEDDKTKGYERYIKAFMPYKDDPAKGLDAWTKKKAGMWLPYQPNLVVQIGGLAADLRNDLRTLNGVLGRDPLDEDRAQQLLTRIKQIAQELQNVIPSDGAALKKCVETHIVKKTDERVAQAMLNARN
ncbi:MAG TPA: hypothetical protein VGE52_17070, partial [Pirellulales bacterium]